MMIPDIRVYVRHSAGCPHSDDEVYQSCKCRKHLRWTANGVQHRQSAKTRSWSKANERRREIERGFEGPAPVSALEARMTLAEIGAQFLLSKKNSGDCGPDSMKKYEQAISRLDEFMKERGVMFPAQITDDHLEAYRETWPRLYPGSVTRRHVQNRMLSFFRHCVAKKHLAHLPLLSKIKVTEKKTEPLTPAEYERLRASALVAFDDSEWGKKIAALASLMRWSGLAIRDASTLKRSAIVEQSGSFRIVTKRSKTGVAVSNSIPPAAGRELLGVANGNPEYIFWNRGEGNADTASHYFGKKMNQAAEHAGIADFHSHRLRDTFAVRLLEAGVPMEQVSKALGHTSIKTTEKYYAPWNKTRQDRLDAELSKAW
jgi:integrase/recombinase XerD